MKPIRQATSYPEAGTIDPDATVRALVEVAGRLVYGLPSASDGGPRPAFKVAEHERGAPTNARDRDRVVDPGSRARMTAFVERRLPGLVPEVVAEMTCLYTVTDDQDFVLDREGPVVVASPCSGHGAKFTPLLGEVLADLATGDVAGSNRFALRPRRTVPG